MFVIVVVMRIVVVVVLHIFEVVEKVEAQMLLPRLLHATCLMQLLECLQQTLSTMVRRICTAITLVMDLYRLHTCERVECHTRGAIERMKGLDKEFSVSKVVQSFM